MNKEMILVEKKDFFISYTGKDRDWAVWVAWHLEEAGYSTIIQDWDFRPGSNFVLKMHQALQDTERMISIFSKEYLQSIYGTPEWAAVFSQDPMGNQNKIVPVKIGECEPTGLLQALVWVQLIGLSETDARKTLLNGVRMSRSKPQHPPVFPSERNVTDKPDYPKYAKKSNVYIPKIKKSRTDLDISNFIDASFQIVSQYFSEGTEELTKQHPQITMKFQKIHDTKFICKAFRDGNNIANCKIWIEQSSYSNPQICFSEGRYSIESDGSYNESLSIGDDPHNFRLKTFMSFCREEQFKVTDFNNLLPEEAAEFLWRRFTSPLEQ